MALYAWIIDKDMQDPGSSDEGVTGGHDAPARMVDRLKESPAYGTPFRMVDGDDEVMYLGRILAEHPDGSLMHLVGCDETFLAPLDDFGAPNAGATEIQYKGSSGQWIGL